MVSLKREAASRQAGKANVRVSTRLVGRVLVRAGPGATVAHTGSGRANCKVGMNGGLEAGLVPTVDPFDRAHNVHAGAYLASAGDPRTGGPARNLVATPRRYHPSNMPAARVVGGVVVGRIGVDSAADDLADRLDWIALTFGVDLLRGGKSRTVAGFYEETFQQVRIRDLIEPSRAYDLQRLKRSANTRDSRHESMVRKFLASKGCDRDGREVPAGRDGGREQKKSVR